MRVAEIHGILKKYWGYDAFREKQLDIIQSALSGKDTLALLPTGGGKSICFQVPAMAEEGMCLVISPLIALMEDQVMNLQKRGIKAMAISSALNRKELDIALDNAAYGDYKFLYLSPERLQTEWFKARLPKMNINLIAIDEAHCISQWGYDFRPAYLNIASLRESLPEIPVLALTATATPKVVEDIQFQLAFKSNNVIRKSFKRDNLAYVVLEEEDPEGRMLKVIRNVGGSGVIYCNRRLKCKHIAAKLKDEGIAADFYHGGLDHVQRSRVQEEWINNRIQVVVATNAFGMGIDKADVRFVIHLDYPNSLEAYYQEAGRGGRDGKKAYAVMMASESQAKQLKDEFERSFPAIETIKKVYLALSNYFQIPIDGGEMQTEAFDLYEFSKRYDMEANSVHSSLQFLAKEGYISLSEAYYQPSKLKMLLGKEDLYKFQVSHKLFDPLIKTILRSYGGLFESYSRIDEHKLAAQLNTNKGNIINALKKLSELEVLDYLAANDQAHITYLKPRLDQRSLIISKENYKDRKDNAKAKLEEVIYYTESQIKCRSQILLEYFGEMDSEACGQCDICLKKQRMNLSELKFSQIRQAIRRALEEESQSLLELSKVLSHYEEELFVNVLETLMDEGIVLETKGLLSWEERE